MIEERYVVSDDLWNRLSKHLPGKADDSGVTAKDNRLFLEAVFWRVRTGSPWRDLPVRFELTPGQAHDAPPCELLLTRFNPANTCWRIRPMMPIGSAR